MRSTLIHVLSWAMLATVFTAGFSSCKKEYDAPPVHEYPALEANATIQSIIARHTLGQAATKIEDNVILEGIVVGDDKSGNIYKNIFIQDETAGIQVRVDANSTYTNYPVGRKVWIKAQNLYIGDYNGTPQLSVETGAAIPAPMIANYLIGGERGLTVEPAIKTIASLTNADVNTLIKLENIEFSNASVGQTYANPGQSVSHNLKDCNGATIVLRSSGYADFAPERTPGGNGDIVALYTLFGTTPQLTIRDLSDINMNGTRCDGSTGGGTNPGAPSGAPMTIEALRAAYTGAQMQAPVATITGVVISDRLAANVDSRTLYIQDGDYGIALRTTNAHSFNLGETIEVGIGDDNMSEFNGLLQVYVNNANMRLATNQRGNITPREITIADLSNNLNRYEGTLVKINGATLSGSTFNGSRPLVDASGTTVYYTRSAATFSGTALPQGTVDVVGIVSEHTSGMQILPRTAADVIGGTSGGGTNPNPNPTPGAGLMSISDLRALYQGSNITLSGQKIRGVVISYKAALNIHEANIVLQNGTSGVVVRFNSGNNHTFAIGDSLEIDLTGASLEIYNGLLQVNRANLTTTTTIATGIAVTPRIATVADILANVTGYESTLVTIQNATLSSAAGTYNGTVALTDASGTIDMYTRSQATFASATLPTGTVNVTGIIGMFNTAQIQIRNTSDVQ